MKKFFITLTLMCIIINASGQSPSDSIQVKKRLGPVFQQNGRTLTPNQLLTVTKSNPDAFAEMKVANNNYVASLFFQIPGGFLIGYPIGTSLGGGDPNWTMAAIGAGLVIFAIPLISAYNKHATNAVNIYNKGLRSSLTPTSSLNLRVTSNGVGLRISF